MQANIMKVNIMKVNIMKASTTKEDTKRVVTTEVSNTLNTTREASIASMGTAMKRRKGNGLLKRRVTVASSDKRLTASLRANSSFAGSCIEAASRQIVCGAVALYAKRPALPSSDLKAASRGYAYRTISLLHSTSLRKRHKKATTSLDR
jgi:hypothetical protein